MKTILVITCLLLILDSSVAQRPKDITEWSSQFGRMTIVGKPSFMYVDGSSTSGFGIYRHSFFSEKWALTFGAGFQGVDISTNVNFQQSGGQVIVAAVPNGYMFNKLLLAYINLPLMINYIPFRRNGRATAIRVGPSLGRAILGRWQAFAQGSLLKGNLPIDRHSKLDLNMEVSTLLLSQAERRRGINVGVGTSIQLTDFTKDANSFSAFSTYFRVGFQL